MRQKAVFLDGSTVTTRKRVLPSILAVLSVFAILFTTLFTTLPKTMENTHAEAGSFAMFCGSDGTLGHNMSQSPSWGLLFAEVRSPDLGQRDYNLQEIVGTSTQKSHYYGESPADGSPVFIFDTDPNRIPNGNENGPEGTSAIPMLTDPSVIARMEAPRGFGHCVVGLAGDLIGNLFFAIGSMVTEATSWVTTMSFDTNLICKDPENPSGACINLLKVIGGTKGSNNGGIIGSLANGIYFPMLTLAVLLTGIWVGYKGIVKRQFREALSGAGWTLLAVFLGLLFLLNPHMLARAPMTVNNTISGCVLGAFNGENCFDDSAVDGLIFDPSNGTTANICNGSVDGLPIDEKLSQNVSNLGCSIWKAFSLEPYAQMSYGKSLEDLDVYTGDVAKLWEKYGDRLPPQETFCVPLGSTEAPGTKGFDTLNLDRAHSGNTVCNIAVYELMLKQNSKWTYKDTVSAKNEADAQKFGSNFDSRWYNVISVVATDRNYWNHWAPTGGTQAGYMLSGFVSILNALLSGVVLIVASLFALAYYVLTVIIVTFAPLFFLFGVHPGRGKRIFMGWLSQLVGNTLKYLASAIFLIIAISIYGGVLGNATNPAISFLFVLIVSIALFLYRKEIINMLSRVGFAGETLPNKFSGLGKKTGRMATASTGAAVGTVLAGGSGFKGAKEGALREGKIGKGFTSNVFRQYDRSSKENLTSQRKEIREAKQDADYTKSQIDENLKQEHLATTAQQTALGEIGRLKVEIVDHEDKLEKSTQLRKDISIGLNDNANRMVANGANPQSASVTGLRELANLYEDKSKFDNFTYTKEKLENLPTMDKKDQKDYAEAVAGLKALEQKGYSSTADFNQRKAQLEQDSTVRGIESIVVKKATDSGKKQIMTEAERVGGIQKTESMRRNEEIYDDSADKINRLRSDREVLVEQEDNSREYARVLDENLTEHERKHVGMSETEVSEMRYEAKTEALKNVGGKKTITKAKKLFTRPTSMTPPGGSGSGSGGNSGSGSGSGGTP